jgi:hypothetical protein
MLIFKDGVVADYRKIFPNVSFPASGPSDKFLSERKAVRVNQFIPHDRATQKLVACAPYVQDGWAYTVKVESKTAEEIIADAASKASQVRAQRDRLLSASDWTQTLDAPVDRTAWATYRQALRDLPSQEGWPNVTMPSEPGVTLGADTITGA